MTSKDDNGKKGLQAQARKPSGNGNYKNALSRNRTKAGIAPEPSMQVAPTPQIKDSGGNNPPVVNEPGFISRSFANATLKTKAIVILGFVGIFLFASIELLKPRITDDGSGESTQDDFSGIENSQAARIARTVNAEANRNANSGSINPKGRKRTALDDEVCTPDEKLRTMWTQFLPKERYIDGAPITIRNSSDQIAFIGLQSSDGRDLSTTVVIMPGDMLKFPVAGRRVAGSVSSGSLWCNRKVGWKDPRISQIQPATLATPDTLVMRINLFNKGSNLIGARIFNERPGKPAPAQFL